MSLDMYVFLLNTLSVYFVSVSALKPEEMPKVRTETEEGQSAGYEVYHQKLV